MSAAVAAVLLCSLADAAVWQLQSLVQRAACHAQQLWAGATVGGAPRYTLGHARRHQRSTLA